MSKRREGLAARGARRPLSRSMGRRALVATTFVALLGSGAGQLDGKTGNNVIMTTTSSDGPPTLLGFNARSYLLTTVRTYTLDELVARGISRINPSTGENRTLRPASVVIQEGTLVDSIYWADAGAGAILGLRLDGSAILVRRAPTRHCPARHTAQRLQPLS